MNNEELGRISSCVFKNTNKSEFEYTLQGKGTYKTYINKNYAPFQDTAGEYIIIGHNDLLKNISFAGSLVFYMNEESEYSSYIEGFVNFIKQQDVSYLDATKTSKTRFITKTLSSIMSSDLPVFLTKFSIGYNDAKDESNHDSSTGLYSSYDFDIEIQNPITYIDTI